MFSSRHKLQGKRPRDEESEDLAKALLLSRQDTGRNALSPAATLPTRATDIDPAAEIDLMSADDVDNLLFEQVCCQTARS